MAVIWDGPVTGLEAPRPRRCITPTRRAEAPASPPQPLEPRRVRGGIADGVLNVPVPQVILNQARVCALIGKGKAAGVAQHVGMGEQGQGGECAVFSQGQIDS